MGVILGNSLHSLKTGYPTA